VVVGRLVVCCVVVVFFYAFKECVRVHINDIYTRTARTKYTYNIARAFGTHSAG